MKNKIIKIRENKIIYKNIIKRNQTYNLAYLICLTANDEKYL